MAYPGPQSLPDLSNMPDPGPQTLHLSFFLKFTLILCWALLIALLSVANFVTSLFFSIASSTARAGWTSRQRGCGRGQPKKKTKGNSYMFGWLVQVKFNIIKFGRTKVTLHWLILLKIVHYLSYFLFESGAKISKLQINSHSGLTMPRT